MAVNSPKEFMETVLPEKLSDPAALKDFDLTLQFNISGDNGGNWVLKIKDQKATIEEGTVDKPTITLEIKDTNYLKLINGELSGQKAFMTGKLKFKGDMNIGVKLQELGII